MESQIVSTLTDDVVSDACILWGLTGQPMLLDDVTNFVYEVKSSSDRQILRLTPSSHHTQDEVEAELDWVQYLHLKGVPACRPLMSLNGRFTERVGDGNLSFIVASFEYAEGSEIDEYSPGNWNVEFFQNYGRLMGRMHRLTKSYDPKNLKTKRAHWTEDDLICKSRDYLPKSESNVADSLDGWIEAIGRNPQTADTYGLIHADMNPTNFHAQNGRIKVFDFDDCSYSWFINDIAVAMPLYSKFIFSVNWEDQLKVYFSEFMNGYDEENQLDKEWLERLPLCLRIQNAITLIALYKMNIPGSKYHSFYELVNGVYKNGHRLFEYDFLKEYAHSKATSHSDRVVGKP